MAWNYRIVRHHRSKTWYGLHEIYFDQAGKPKGMIDDPVDFVAEMHEGPEHVLSQMAKALKEAQSQPVLDEDDIPKCWPFDEANSNVTPLRRASA